MLSCVLRCTPHGFEYEASPRQAEKLLEGLNFDSNSSGATTPGLKPLTEQLIKDEQLQIQCHTEFRGLAARANSLSADRIDLQFSAKGICRVMRGPTDTSMVAFERRGRYMLGHKRLVYTCPWQSAYGIEVCSATPTGVDVLGLGGRPPEAAA